MDIVRFLDTHFGKVMFSESVRRADLTGWIQDAGTLFRELLMPRWAAAPLEEFATPAARAYFTGKKEAMVGPFSAALARTPALKPQMEAALERLAPMIRTAAAVNGDLSYDDIDLFGRLRGVTLIKDLRIAAPVRAYLEYFSQVSGVPLHYEIAL